MLNGKSETVVTNLSLDAVIDSYRLYDISPRLSSFSHDSMKFYMRGMTGGFKASPKFRVVVTVEPCSDGQNLTLHLHLKHSFQFHLMIFLSVLLFLYILWFFLSRGTSFLFFAAPLILALLALMEDSWQQDICMNKLKRAVQQAPQNPCP